MELKEKGSAYSNPESDEWLKEIEQFANFLESSEDTKNIKSDDDLDRHDEISLFKHNESYDSILNDYTKHVSKTLQAKRWMKKVFYWIAVIIMIISFLYIIICSIIIITNLSSNLSFNLQDYLAPLISAVVSFLTVFIIIPKIIAEYLFNSGEDSSMQNIIASIQEYDKFVRGDLHKNQKK